MYWLLNTNRGLLRIFSILRSVPYSFLAPVVTASVTLSSSLPLVTASVTLSSTFPIGDYHIRVPVTSMSLCIDDRLVGRFGWGSKPAHQTVIYRVTYTRFRIDTINSPDDGHMAARNMYRIEINSWKRTVRQVGYLQRLYCCAIYLAANNMKHNSFFK
jgi:hypothetical protein